MAATPKPEEQVRIHPLLQALARRREDLGRLIPERRASLDSHGNLGGTVGDSADAAFHRASAEVESGMIDRYLRELVQIEAAEARAAAGTFGVCVDCEAPIGASRLEASPTALRCLACQESREK